LNELKNLRRMDWSEVGWDSRLKLVSQVESAVGLEVKRKIRRKEKGREVTIESVIATS
jgi:hypothetical protein